MNLPTGDSAKNETQKEVSRNFVTQEEPNSQWCPLLVVVQSCPTLCNPMDRSTPGFSVHHYLLEFAQTHVHWVDDINQPSPPLSPSSPPALSLSQHQGLSSELALCIRWPKYWSFSFLITPSSEDSWLISFKIDWFDLLEVQGTLKVFSSTTVGKHLFFGAQPSLWSNCHVCPWLLKTP